MKVNQLMLFGTLLFISALIIAACEREESFEGQLPQPAVTFEGKFYLNEKNVLNDFRPFILIKGDSAIGINFTKYKLVESMYGYDREFSILDMKLDDTIALQLPRPYSFDMGYAVIDYDHITCTWRNTAEGYFYAERLSDISFKVDTWGVLVKEVCSGDQGEPDTIRVSLNGVFTLL